MSSISSKKHQELQNREQELELSLQKRLIQERTRLMEQIRREEADRNNLKDTEYQMRPKEMEKQLEDQRRLAEEMRRKAEQGSMQLQGEVQELALEEMLRATFPFDAISEVGKGVRGADCIQTVRNQFGQECGKDHLRKQAHQQFLPGMDRKAEGGHAQPGC